MVEVDSEESVAMGTDSFADGLGIDCRTSFDCTVTDLGMGIAADSIDSAGSLHNCFDTLGVAYLTKASSAEKYWRLSNLEFAF